MRAFWREHVQFLQEYRKRFESTGAVAPSSRFLARALARPLACHGGQARVLEVGPGTGAVTKRIVKLLKPQDHFDLVELNEAFVETLRWRFEHEPAFQRVAGQSTIHHGPIQSFTANGQYDFIICGLPFNNFEPALVREIFEVFFKLLAPEGVITYFEYMWMRPLRRLVSGQVGRERLRRLEWVLQEYLAKSRIRRDWVFVNVPPAWVQHLRHNLPVGAAAAPANKDA